PAVPPGPLCPSGPVGAGSRHPRPRSTPCPAPVVGSCPTRYAEGGNGPRHRAALTRGPRAGGRPRRGGRWNLEAGRAVNEQQEAKKPKGRKNGLYSGISDELAESMRTGWADTDRDGLEPGPQAPYAAKRRKAL